MMAAHPPEQPQGPAEPGGGLCFISFKRPRYADAQVVVLALEALQPLALTGRHNSEAPSSASATERPVWACWVSAVSPLRSSFSRAYCLTGSSIP
jgi:hypothetical protein